MPTILFYLAEKNRNRKKRGGDIRKGVSAASSSASSATPLELMHRPRQRRAGFER